jgi:hypothetical protein
MRLLPLLACALLLPGCAAPRLEASDASLGQHPCPVPPPAQHDAEPDRDVWRGAGCLVAGEDATGLRVGDASFAFPVPAGAARVRALLHLDGQLPAEAALRDPAAEVARASAGPGPGDTVLELRAAQPRAGDWELRAHLQPLQPLQGWWATVEVVRG